MSPILLVGHSPIFINGRFLITATSYSLETSIIDGKRTAKGKIVFAIPEDGPEIDFDALIAQPFTVRARVGAVNYSVEECVADGPTVMCSDSIVDGEWVTADAGSGDVRLGLRFSSSNVHIITGA